MVKCKGSSVESYQAMLASDVLRLVAYGRISIGRAAELLKVPVQDIHRLAEKHGVSLGPTREQRAKSAETLKKLLRKG